MIFNLNNLITTVLYAKKLLQVAKYDESYPLFFEQLMEVKVSRRESGDMGSIPDEC